MPRPPLRLVVSWLVAALLLAANIALAFAGLAAFAAPVHLVIAAVMAGIVLFVFMELDRGVSLLWVFAGAGFFWLAILFALGAADYFTRYGFALT